MEFPPKLDNRAAVAIFAAGAALSFSACGSEKTESVALPEPMNTIELTTAPITQTPEPSLHNLSDGSRRTDTQITDNTYVTIGLDTRRSYKVQNPDGTIMASVMQLCTGADNTRNTAKNDLMTYAIFKDDRKPKFKTIFNSHHAACKDETLSRAEQRQIPTPRFLTK